MVLVPVAVSAQPTGEGLARSLAELARRHRGRHSSVPKQANPFFRFHPTMAQYSVEDAENILRRALLLRPAWVPLFQARLVKQMPGGPGAAGAGPDPDATYSPGELLRTIATTPGPDNVEVKIVDTITPDGDDGPGLRARLPPSLYVAWAAGAEMDERWVGDDDDASREDIKSTLIELMPTEEAKDLVRNGNWASGVLFHSKRGGTRRRRRRTQRRR